MLSLLALGESVNISNIAQLSIFIKDIDNSVNVFEKLLSFEAIHRTIKRSGNLESFERDFNKLEFLLTKRQ